MKLNTHTIGQQWPQLEALLVHMVERVEELESAAAHKDRQIEVLTRKTQLMEEQQKERQTREVQQDLIKTQHQHGLKKTASATGKQKTEQRDPQSRCGKLLIQLNTFSQAIMDYVRTTAQGSVPTPKGNTQ